MRLLMFDFGPRGSGGGLRGGSEMAATRACKVGDNLAEYRASSRPVGR